MFDWHSLLDDAIAIAGALSASVFVYKLVKIYVMKPIHDTWDKFQRVIILSENIHSLLTPNGGSSLSDTINKISQEVSWTTARIKIMSMRDATMVVETNAKGELTNANKHYLQFVDKSLEEVVRNSWLNCIAEVDRDRVWKTWLQAVDQERDYESEFNMIIKGGDDVAVRCIVTTVSNNKHILGYLGVIEIVS